MREQYGMSRIAGANKARLFNMLVYLNEQKIETIAHVATKKAIERGYVKERKSVKGVVLANWARWEGADFEVDGPPKWGGMIASDMILEEGTAFPKWETKEGVELWITILSARNDARNFETLEALLNSVPERALKAGDREMAATRIRGRVDEWYDREKDAYKESRAAYILSMKDKVVSQ